MSARQAWHKLSPSTYMLHLTRDFDFPELKGVHSVYVDPEQAAQVGDLAIFDLPGGSQLLRVGSEDDLKHVIGRVAASFSLTNPRPLCRMERPEQAAQTS